MEAELQAHVAFFLTGRRTADQLDEVGKLDLRPVLFSGLGDLTKLRYDFPLVLIKDRAEDVPVLSLSGLIDGLLDQVAKDDDGDRIRKHLLRLEQDIRTLVAEGSGASLSATWDQAARPLAAADKLAADSLARARAALKFDGELVDCDERMPARLLKHFWSATQTRRAEKFGKDVGRLILKLSDILKADFVKSDAGKSAANLKASFGSGPMDAFDFEAMSRLLKKSFAESKLPRRRRLRVEHLIAVLKAQRFFPAGQDSELYAFFFETCSAAQEAYRERLPKAIELARAIAIAELEIKGEYDEARHDSLFEYFGENGLDPKELASFPDYLVCVNAAKLSLAESEKLTEILAAGLPVKVLVQTDDILEASPVGQGQFAFGSRSKQLASVAMGMNEVFVLQSPSSNLFQSRKQIQKGLDYSGPALFSVFSGAAGGGVPPYLTAAAAMSSRAFPAFSFDPAAGPNWASRFSLAENPQAELDWPVQGFAYEDEDLQSVSEKVAFTLLDFVACDHRYAQHFARVPRAKWNGSLISVDEGVAREAGGLPDKVPSLLMIAPDNTLQKVIVDEQLIREARRCRSMWHSLQELGGIHNSHAESLLAREKKAWQEALQRAETPDLAVAAVAKLATAVATSSAPAAESTPSAPAEAAPAPDQPYIETTRCSTCNECTQINNKMFAYDANQQAHIANPDAGTYAQLVEAAESCQVSIIHPGKPRNPNEPGLAELIQRAQPFL